MALSGNYRVYAVDIIGEAGNSEEYRPDLNSDAFALWMKDVLDALGLEKPVIIGNSLGGWMALKFATAYPERVSRLVLIASAGLAEIRPQFIQNVDQSGKVNGDVSFDSGIIGEQDIPKEVLEFMKLIVESYNPIPYLPVYSDEQLQRLKMPVLFIDGEKDVIIDAEQSAQRLSRLIPSSEIRILPNCGHVITNSMEYILPFLVKTIRNYMIINQFTSNGTDIAVVKSDEVCIFDVASALDFMSSISYETGSHSIVINKEAVIEDFFVLSTKIAGEILQKFINYRFKLAIVGDFSGYTSKSLKDFIYESNQGRDIFFVASEADAIEKLSKA
jgi:esterase/lipase